MAKYKVWAEVEFETGTKHPREPKVKWAARRIEAPTANLGGYVLDHSRATIDDGLRRAIDAVKDDAATRGEALSHDDIEADVQHVTLTLKRHKVDKVQRTSTTSFARSLFDEVMAGPPTPSP